MILGVIDDDGVPVVIIPAAGRSCRAIVDTGFNGDLELPNSLRPFVNARFLCRIPSLLAAGQIVEEDTYHVDFVFDGQVCLVEVTFLKNDDILIGTNLLKNHLLEIDFPAETVRLERVS